MLNIQPKQLSFYSDLYSRIPENHLLKMINRAVDFSFVNKLLAGSYCTFYGRPAREPELMIRLSVLQRLYNLSDEQVIIETDMNLAYKYFTGLNPEDNLPDSSLLAKFRTQRLKELSLDEIITEIIRQCVEKGVISKENGISIDTTHILANTTKKVPERIMKHLAKKIFKAMGKEDYAIPDYTQIADHQEAKQVMKDYLEEVIATATPEAEKEVLEAKEILQSDLFIEQKGIRSIVDKDARVGHKSKTENFFGYKMEYSLTTDGQLITGVGVHNGAYVDGTCFNDLYELAVKPGLDIKEMFGDKAYFKKDIINRVIAGGGLPYIPVNHSAYRVDEELYSYNKDSDQWFCVKGNETISRTTKTTIRKDRGKSSYYEYTFKKEQCENCSLREECLQKAKSKAKKLHIGLNTNEYYEYSQWAKTEEFLEEYKKRARIEGKNSELKRFHELARAKGYELRSVATQAKFTAIAVNLKRIVKLLSSLNNQIICSISNLWSKICDYAIEIKSILRSRHFAA